MGLFTKVFGTYSQRELKSIYPIVDKITALEDEYKQLTDAELQAKTPEFKERLANGETLDDILPEAFAAVREAADRVLGMRPYPVQLVGGIVLHQGRIAEMKTGEGKTLVATLPAYLNALTGEGVHIVTVNDYLAKRDSEWMGKVHRFMGLTVGLIIHDMKKEERQKAYQADITYGTNNEMGFDYLRDNMALYANEQVQRGHAFAIVDEVDSILIDEARTPLIISGMGEKSTQLYDMAEMFAARLKKFVVVESDDKEEEATDIDADYVVDEKARSVTLTARGVKKAEEFFHVENLSDPSRRSAYHGSIETDRYGRSIPKQAHGTQNLDDYTSSSHRIMNAAVDLFDRLIDPTLLIRRLYIVANHIIPEDTALQKKDRFTQLDLFTDYAAEEQKQKADAADLERERKLQEAMLSIRKKFGKNAVLKAMNLEEGATAKDRNNQIGGHKA